MANGNIFNLRPSADIVAERGAAFARAAGVYFIFFDALEGLLQRLRLATIFNPDRPYSQEGYELLYVGASVDPCRAAFSSTWTAIRRAVRCA